MLSHPAASGGHSAKHQTQPWDTQFQQGCAHKMPLEAAAAAFKAEHIVGDVVPAFHPTTKLDVSYGGVHVTAGAHFTPKAASGIPEVTWTPESSSAHYSLFLVDPDAPSRASHKMREWRHWAVVNIPGNDLTKGQTLTEYSGPTPPAGSGPHRYIFLLYKQPDVSAAHFEDIPPQRGQWHVGKFAKGDLVGGTFFFAENR